MEMSIIIRTRNEERWIGRVLERLYSQTYKDFEVVVVDSGSSDRTLEIVSKFPVKLIQIEPGSFSYPYALNLGIRNSRGEKYITILSAHSLPVSDLWLDSGIKHLAKENIMGVYGPLKAMPDATIWDKLFHNISYFLESLVFPKKYRIIKKGGLGVLGFTNAIIKKELWEKHNFNEEYGAGGEDAEWANYWFARGYYAIKDKGFTVHHSHYLNFPQWRQQLKYWSSTSTTPQPFRYLKFRKDKTHGE